MGTFLNAWPLQEALRQRALLSGNSFLTSCSARRAAIFATSTSSASSAYQDLSCSELMRLDESPEFTPHPHA
jgi:hypothetical protein